MGCAVSKKDKEDDVVSLCRDRKKLLKLAIESRYAFAEAHCKYNQSLCAVAAAIKLFIARHSSALLITFPSESPPEEERDKDVCQQGRFQQISESETETEAEDDDGSEICEHFYDKPISPCQNRSPPVRGFGFGWDFFYPFGQNPDEGFRVLREEKVMKLTKGDVVVNNEKSKGLTTMSVKGKELLGALKDVEDYFLRAYDSGLDVSKMLEVNRVQLLSGLEGIKENSNKLMQTATLSRSISFSSSSCRSLLTSASRSSSMWTELNDDLFDYCGGMEAGSHALTLERLYSWEKKLYDEVKAGDREARKMHERKCLRSKHYGFKNCSIVKVRFKAKDLQSKLFVAEKRVESISHRIQTLRDKELHPQLVELLHGIFVYLDEVLKHFREVDELKRPKLHHARMYLVAKQKTENKELMRNWETMAEIHKAQNQIMHEVKSYNFPADEMFCADSHRLATLQLEAEVHNWRACFIAYVSTHKSYTEHLTLWLSKFLAPETEPYSRVKSRAPPLLIIFHNWLACLKKLPDKAVTCSMKGFEMNIRAMWVQQGEVQRQKRKVDVISKEIECKVVKVHKAEREVLDAHAFDQKIDTYIRNQQHSLNLSRKKLDLERAKNICDMEETKQITLVRLKTGFSSVFESLAEFSEASANMYEGLVTQDAKCKGSCQNN